MSAWAFPNYNLSQTMNSDIGTRFKSPKYETNMQPNQRYQWVFGNITFRNVDIVTVKRQTIKIAQKIIFFLH